MRALEAALGVALALGCAGVPEAAREGCAWEATRLRSDAGDAARTDACLARLGFGADAARWREGPGSSPTDMEVCLESALSGVRRQRACLDAAGHAPGDARREAKLAARACDERSFEGSRYGPFTLEFESCLARRGWRADRPSR